jgi:hypothetical protein
MVKHLVLVTPLYLYGDTRRYDVDLLDLVELGDVLPLGVMVERPSLTMMKKPFGTLKLKQ